MIDAYTPTNGVDERTKEDFYEKLQEVAEQIDRRDMVIITGDMNVKVEKLVNSFEKSYGRTWNGFSVYTLSLFLPNCNLLRTLEFTFFGTLFPRIYGRH